MALISVLLETKEVHQYASGITAAEVITDVHGKKHGCVAAIIDGVQKDLSFEITSDCEIIGIKVDSNEGMYILRHSCAHLLAQAVTELFPNAKPTIGPPVEGGFYYDFSMENIGDGELKEIEKLMQKLCRENLKIQRLEYSEEELREIFKQNPYKIEIINDKLGAGQGSSLYKQGEFVDLCLGPHVPATSNLMHFKLTNISSAYWKGDQKNEQLVRIYGMVYPTKNQLKERIRQLSEAKLRDHRIIGKEMKLFHIDETVGQGLILWTPRGAAIRQELQKFISSELHKQYYKQVFTPHIGKLDLYRASGHFPYYQESQYPPLINHEEMKRFAEEGCSCSDLANKMQDGEFNGYLLKPMNCPHHIKIYSSQPRSYRELPLRLAEFGTVYRWEQSGEISGMTRVRGFTQDDAHLFCREDQIEQELLGCLSLVKIIFSTLGMENYRVRVGLRDPDSSKYVGLEKSWDAAENACRNAAKSLGVDFSEEPGEAAFYGPKIDFVVKDVLGREWQLGTVQVDYNLPERFDLQYAGADGKLHRPVMIHRAPFGSMERFCGVLIEHFAGKFPTWLSPTQVAIATISEKHSEYAEQLANKLHSLGIRVDSDFSDSTIGKKIKNLRKLKPPYTLIIGDEEVKNNSISIRGLNNAQRNGIPINDFISEILDEINLKKVGFNLTPKDN
ncbi:MAG: threonine--tRNA ligase [Euryarchaeota archaeon]|nr:threonine--tRNA ligase [Euryarchaeota archaeon]